ncbi:MAG: hypothetical protein ACPL3P_01215 [Anaerolineales bacterium]
MKQSRGSLYLLTGFLLGLGIGLVYALLIQPVHYTDIAPSMLDAADKDRYRALIAIAYNADRDLVRARARLALLKDEDPYRALAEQAQRWLAEGKSQEEARALGILAVSLAQAQATILAPPTSNNPSPASPVVKTITSEAVQLETPSSPNLITQATPAEGVNNNPIQPLNASPTPQVTPTLALRFQLSKRESVCDPAQGQSLIQVYTWDANGAEVPGVELVVTWEGGENHFFTGLKPELGAGYADFSMTPNITYTLRIASGGEPVMNLSAPACTTSSGEKYWGNWVLEFSAP